MNTQVCCFTHKSNLKLNGASLQKKKGGEAIAVGTLQARINSSHDIHISSIIQNEPDEQREKTQREQMK